MLCVLFPKTECNDNNAKVPTTKNAVAKMTMVHNMVAERMPLPKVKIFATKVAALCMKFCTI